MSTTTGSKKKVSKAKESKPKPKTVDIFSLYKNEKIITVKDDSGNEVKILFVKPTQGERQKLLEKYVDILSEVRSVYQEKDTKTKYYTKAIHSLGKEHLIEGIVNYQSSQRAELLDLYPIPENTALNEAEQKEEQEKLMQGWHDERKKDLESMTVDQLRKELGSITLEGLSLIESGRRFDFLSLQVMCLNPLTREPIFETPELVEGVRDRRILDFLLDQLNEFRSFENMSKVREASEDQSFLEDGESAKD